MSSVAFHSPDHETVRVGGAERAWMGAMVRRIFDGILDVHSYPSLDTERSAFGRIMQMLRPDSSLRSYTDLHSAARFMPAHIEHSDNPLVWNGHVVNAFSLSLNTALICGSNPIRLSARLHAQCEIHAWIDGPNRSWVADIIEEGLASGVFRDAHQTQYENWPGVIKMLRSSKKTPVVTSYSVCESFPGPHMVDLEPDKPWKEMTESEQQELMDKQDTWREQDEDKQWEQAFAALKGSDRGLEIKPDNWKAYFFDPKISALDILARNWTDRLDAQFPK